MKVLHKIKFVGERSKYLVNCLKNRSVIHIGACDAPHTEEKIRDNLWLHSDLSEECEKVKGFDIASEYVKYANNLGYENIEKLDLFEANTDYFHGFDYVLFSETIEHLENPGKFIEQISLLMDSNQVLIITTPNTFFIKNFWRGIRGLEVNHSDHMCAFTFQTLSQLVEKNNLSVLHKFSAEIKRPNENWMSKLITRMISHTFPLLGENIILLCKKTVIESHE